MTEKIIVECLVTMGIIHSQFTGSLTLHFNQGAICDIDRLERSLKVKKYLDKTNGFGLNSTHNKAG